jgi:CheY-like chemotaxis protein
MQFMVKRGGRHGVARWQSSADSHPNWCNGAQIRQGVSMTRTSPISAKRVLVVEDEYLVAMDMSAFLEAAGAHVIGPASNVNAALEVLEHTELDAAILDVNLRGEMAYPVADALAARGIPFVFTTGYDTCTVPVRFAGVKRCEKPTTPEAISRALFGAGP